MRKIGTLIWNSNLSFSYLHILLLLLLLYRFENFWYVIVFIFSYFFCIKNKWSLHTPKKRGSQSTQISFFFESSPFAVSHTWIWIWVIKIQIPCFDSLQKVKNLDLTNSSRILNLKILEFEITFKPIEF